MKTMLLILVSLLLLLGAGTIALNLWLDLEGVSLGFHGWLALGLGVLASLAVGIGLMALVFLSARRGYDDIGGKAPGPGRPESEGPESGGPGPARGDDAQR